MTTIDHHIQRLDHAHQRLDQQDARLKHLETNSAVSSERLDNVQKSLDKIESGQTWLIRIVIGAIVAAGLALLLNGGVNVRP